MTYSKYKRGSEWCKWDLHVHSLMSSRFEKNPDEFKNKWEQFKTQLKYADCKVIGINDYFSVTGYKKIKEEIESGDLELPDKVIIPVVEMRMDTILLHKNTTTNSGTSINFHIIFSNTVDIDDIVSFIKFLKYKGKRSSSDYDDREKLKHIKVDFDDTIEELKGNRKLKDKFLIWLPYDEYGGIDGINPESDSWIKEGLIRKAHILGSANKKQIAFFLWQDPKHKEEEYRKWLGNKKPCIKGSDSHDYSYSIGKLQGKDSKATEKFCWIKADPSFEGLRQIVYEPEDRVKIQSPKPEKKSDSQLINKIKIIGNLFSSEEIFINQNLTVIIGGKSTGKSLLLRSIAETINPKQVSERLKEVPSTSNYENIDADILVTWRDGQENQKDKSSGIERRIIYIPQSYLNRLVEKKEGRTAIYDIIDEIIKQEDTIKNIFRTLTFSNRSIEGKLKMNIETLFHIEQDRRTLSEEIKNIGDKEGIQYEIQQLKESLIPQEQTGITEQNRLDYESLRERILFLRGRQDMIDRDLGQLDNLSQSKSNFYMTPLVQQKLSEVSLEVRELLSERLNSILKYAENNWQDSIANESSKLKEQRQNNEKELGMLYKQIEPLTHKIRNLKLFKEQKQKLEQQEIRFKKIMLKEDEINKLGKDRDTLIQDICQCCLDFYHNFNIAKQGILDRHNIPTDKNLQFDVEVIFKSEAFQEKCINNLYDQRRLNQTEEFSLQDYKFLDRASFKKDIEKIIQETLEGKLVLKTSYLKKDAITILAQNWFRLNYKIKQDGDEISQMSPGKKSLVLLKFLIELDSSECPILLDQPEDDLDNRSIYNDLVKFIKERKKDRQIIIVTHNPNLVVGADAECVIVANQSIDKSKNRKHQFEYVQGSLEYTFSDDGKQGILYKQGIREHVCEILEGGEEAFHKREQKYGLDF